MENKHKKAFAVPLCFFLLGVLFLMVGANGEQMAVNFSRPANASSWTTSGSLIDVFTYVPTIVGGSFLILFISTFSISYYNWQKNG